MSLAETILQSTTKLPPFPMVIQRAIQLIDDPNSSAQQVVDVLQFDQAITANVLKICNSAFFGLRRTIHSLKEAVVMMGFNPLLEIVLSQESLRFFSAPCQGYDLDSGELWRHSVACALLTGIISPRIHRETTPTLFTAALLHDIGKVALSGFVKDYFESIKQRVNEKQLSFVEAEKEVLGVDHAELGGRIAADWNMPENIVAAIRYHHDPSETSDHQEIVQLTCLCDLVAIITGIGGGADGLTYHAHQELMKQYHLKETDVERFIVQLDDRFQAVKETLNLKGSVSPRGSS